MLYVKTLHFFAESVATEGEQKVLTVKAPADGGIDGPSNDVTELRNSGYQEVRYFGLQKHPLLDHVTSEQLKLIASFLIIQVPYFIFHLYSKPQAVIVTMSRATRRMCQTELSHPRI